MPSVSPQPIAMSPAILSSVERNALSVRSASATISFARWNSSMPSSVNVVRRLPRSNSFAPSSSSRSINCLDSVGWVMCSRSAAAVMFCVRATSMK